MPMISREKIDELIQTVDIADVIGEFVSLQTSGKSLKGLCPFHSEKTPSFFVNKEKQVFNCFGCHKKGNVITFIEEYKHLDFLSAVKYLADKYHFDLGNEEVGHFQLNSNRKLFDVNKLAKDFYNLNLLNLDSGKRALAYLESRQLDRQTLNEFQIGYAPSRGNLLLKKLKESFQEFELVEAGLVGRSDSGDYYDLYRDRIIFPILNEQGDVLGFSGRILTDDKSQPKYINTQTTKIFNKGTVLYNLDKALPYITQRKRIVLMEGFFDVIQASKAGVEESICTMGTELTMDQVRKMKKYTDQVVICYDGDQAGQQATYRALQMLEKMHVNVQVAMMPNGLDPDEYIKTYSAAKFRHQLNQNLVDKYDFVYQMIVGKGLDSSSKIETAREGLFKFLNTTASSTIISIYLKKFAEDIHVDGNIIEKDYQKFLVNQRRYRDVERATHSTQKVYNTSKGMIKAEEKIINYYLQSNEFRDIIEEAFRDDAIEFEKGFRREVMFMMRAIYEAHEHLELSLIKSDVIEDVYQSLLDILLKDNYHYSSMELKQLIDSLSLNKLDVEVKRLSKEIGELLSQLNQDLDSVQQEQLNREIQRKHREFQEKKLIRAEIENRRKKMKPSV